MARNKWFVGWILLSTLIVVGCQSQTDPQSEIDSNSEATEENVLASEWPDEVWTEDTMAWRERRREVLVAPDGYLSLAALDFYEPGQWSVGSGDSVTVAMPTGPDQWGQLVLGEFTEDSATPEAWFVPAEEAGVVIEYPHPNQDNPPLPGAVRLAVAGGEDEASRVGAGAAHFYLAIRKGDWAVRVRDPNSTARRNFVGLDYYPLNREFQVVGQFEPHPEGTTIPTGTVLGEILDEPNPGRVVFELGGETFALEAIAAASGDRFFFILADRTSGKDTYGLGRFLYSRLPDEAGQVVLDFNRTYNPPCAFNAFTTCPLPPPENRIDFPIEAGELTYRGEVGQDPDQLPVN